MNAKNNQGSSEFLTGVAFGHCTTWLETFAERSGLPFAILASRVGGLLHASASGQVMGSDDHVPTVRRNTAKRNSTVAQVAVVSRAHRETQVKKTRNWSPEQRKAASLRMKRIQRKLQAARKAAQKAA